MHHLVHLALLASAAVGDVVRVDSGRRSLPGYAEENVALLDLPDAPIGDTLGHVSDAFAQAAAAAAPLARILAMPYFSTYKVDLSDARCPLEAESATCANRQCAVEPLSDADIDAELFREQYLMRLRKDSVSHERPGDEGCAPEEVPLYAGSNAGSVEQGTGKREVPDTSNSANSASDASGIAGIADIAPCDYCYTDDSGVWVDLRDNQERYTGYSGDHARLMWAKIYGENCFAYYGEHPPLAPVPGDDLGKLFGGLGASSGDSNGMGGDSSSLSGLSARDSASETDEPLAEPDCIEQRLFYRLISGMHASISTHLAYDFLEPNSQTWSPNLGEWLERVGWHADRLDNMFFDYVVVSRAIAKLAAHYERQLVFSASCQTMDADVRAALRRLGRVLRVSPLSTAIDEEMLFALPGGPQLKREFRQRSRNVNALMSCVGCERCRLWGKIQSAGYGTALKILFELPAKPSEDDADVAAVLGSLRRSELVALINTFARISHSITATQEFRGMVEEILVDKTSFAYQWKITWRQTKEALGFIFQSYWDLPKNLLVLGGFHLSRLWNQFTTGNEQIDFSQGFREDL